MNISKNIVDTLKDNYMPYAMSVIISRAIPQIDGFKPSHRKLLYTMYEMNLLKTGKTKSANVVGQTMKLNPHGDQAIYETMVRMTKNNESLLYPYVDSKGNFGKVYSRDMKFAASRYTEVKLMDICYEIFDDINKDTVDFVDNYDGKLKEPTLLPTKFPNILINPNKGIAVGMASSIPSFNLSEVIGFTIAYLNNPDTKPEEYIIAPDLPTGGDIILDKEKMREILETGRGSFLLRAKYTVDKKQGMIEISEIPYTTTVESVIEKVVELMKSGKAKEILDIRDETDLKGLKITIDYRKSQDPHKLMLKLFKNTSLEDSFGCNFNILIGKKPMVLGVKAIISHWVEFRRETLKRKIAFELVNYNTRLNLLLGLKSILIDIDKVIKIIRETETEKEVIPALMNSFSLNQEQAEYISEIKLRNLNKEYIIKRLHEIESLEKEIETGNKILHSLELQNKLIISELKQIDKKYSHERKTTILLQNEIENYEEMEEIDDSTVHLFITGDGYFKKITDLSLKRGGEQKLKDSDEIRNTFVAKNTDILWIVTNKANLYQLKISEIEETKSSKLGLYLPNYLEFEPEESIIRGINPSEEFTMMINIYENGKVSKVDFDSYKTKGFRRKVQKIFNQDSNIIGMIPLKDDLEITLISSNHAYLRFSTELINTVSSRISAGVQVAKLPKETGIIHFMDNSTDYVAYPERTLKIPKVPKKIQTNQLTF